MGKQAGIHQFCPTAGTLLGKTISADLTGWHTMRCTTRPCASKAEKVTVRDTIGTVDTGPRSEPVITSSEDHN